MQLTAPEWDIRVICNNMLLGYAGYAVILVYTFWVLRKYKQQMSAQQVDDEENIKRLSLKQVLSTKIGFKLFADHLVRELSIEHLFFLYEIMQLKYELLYQKYVSF